MKKTFFGLSIALVSLILTSCLGDTSSTFEGSGLFTVVSKFEDTGTKYVPTNYGAVTWDKISDYSVGDAVIINYKVNLDKVKGGAFDAEYVTVTETLPNSAQRTVFEEVPLASADAFKDLTLRSFDPNSALIDRWLLAYTVDIKEGQGTDISFFYDESNQNPSEVTNLAAADKPCIVDVVLTITGQPANSNVETKNKNIVVRMANIREIFKPATIDKEIKRSIWLRYKKAGVTNPDFVNTGYILYKPAATTN